MKKWLSLLLTLCMVFSFAACVDTGTTESVDLPTESETVETEAMDIDGSYTSKEDVAAYIEAYGTLPQNFITKNEARSLGWEGGSL